MAPIPIDYAVLVLVELLARQAVPTGKLTTIAVSV
jgi:hypothetical protein